MQKSREPSGGPLQICCGIVSMTNRRRSSLRRTASSARSRSAISFLSDWLTASSRKVRSATRRSKSSLSHRTSALARLSTDDVMMAATITIKVTMAIPLLARGEMFTAWERSGGEAGMKLAAASPVECIAETAAPITTAVPSLRGTVHFVSSRRPNAVSSAIRENKIASRMEHVTTASGSFRLSRSLERLRASQQGETNSWSERSSWCVNEAAV